MAHYRSKIRRASGVWMQVKDPATIKRWRKHRRLTQRELGFLCRCSQNAISLLENGGMTTLSEDLGLELAYRLDVPWEDLFVARESAGVRRMARGASSGGRQPQAVPA